MHELLVHIVILLSAALALGMVAERLGASAVLGYLVAGTLVGPNVLGFVRTGEDIDLLAELGASLLLFTIGTEFSVRRLKRLGPRAFVAGVLQIALTIAVGMAAAILAGAAGVPAFALGAILALSSTAVVARLLVDARALDSNYGRAAMGVLLVQDIAVVPIVLVLAFAGTGGDLREIGLAAGRTLAFAAGVAFVFLLLVRHAIPRLMGARALARNRDLAVVLAMVCALGSAIGAEAAGLPPALGAFIAGVLLGGSPFATQIRADVVPLHTLLVTLFFAGIGLAGDPVWVARNAGLVAGVLAAVLLVKSLLTAGVLRALGVAGATAVAAGATVAQIGEFSFIVAESARAGGFLDDAAFRLVVSVTVGSLALSPLLVAFAGRLARRTDGRRAQAPADEPDPHDAALDRIEVVLVGFGPAGQALLDAIPPARRDRVLVIESNPAAWPRITGLGAIALIGDARRRDLLEHARVDGRSVVVVTVSDPVAVAQIAGLVRAVAPAARIVARARYHGAREEILAAGASAAVDEERLVGLRLAEETLAMGALRTE
ncbi:MAG: inner membrane protein YbaL [Planctomycetota bacterium]